MSFSKKVTPYYKPEIQDYVGSVLSLYRKNSTVGGDKNSSGMTNPKLCPLNFSVTQFVIVTP